MRKRQIIPTLQGAEPSGEAWLDMDRNVLVEVTSEEKGRPIESALLPHDNENPGWRAANPGTQVIRLIFDEPQTLRRFWLVFEDTESSPSRLLRILEWFSQAIHGRGTHSESSRGARRRQRANGLFEHGDQTRRTRNPFQPLGGTTRWVHWRCWTSRRGRS
jgi:hypothetical protein